MRDCRLECVQAIIERQKRMPAEANDDRPFLDRQHRRSRVLWSRPSVHDRAARLPLAHRLLIDAVTSGERSQALFTMLYRSTDREGADPSFRSRQPILLDRLPSRTAAT